MIFWKSCSRLSQTTTFERSGSILDVPGTFQNRKSELWTLTKTLSWKKQKNQYFSKNRKKEGTSILTTCMGRFSCFWKMRRSKKQKIMKKQVVQKHEKLRFGSHFGWPKVIQNGDFFETWKTWKKHGRSSKSETWGCPKVDKNRVEKKQKNMKMQTPKKQQKYGKTTEH